MGSESGYLKLVKGLAVTGFTAILVGTTVSAALAPNSKASMAKARKLETESTPQAPTR